VFLHALLLLFELLRAAPLQIKADGRMRDYVPLSSLAPLKAYAFDISSGE